MRRTLYVSQASSYYVCGVTNGVEEEALTIHRQQGRIKSTLEAVSTVVRKGCRYGWDGVCLAVSMPQSVTPHLPLEFEEAEELCREAGFEYIEGDAKGRNEFGGK